MPNRIPPSALALVLALGFILSTGNANTRATQAGCLVSTPVGDMQGLEVGTSCAFKGIPYAASPAGRRLKAPASPPLPHDFPPRATSVLSQCEFRLPGWQ